MFYIHYTEKWIEEVVRRINEKQLKPEHSTFIIGFFSSMDNEFVDYFKNNQAQISSFSGSNVHIFTPMIFENNLLPDDTWRNMRREFQQMGIPVGIKPTFVFFNLNKTRDCFEPVFFAGFVCDSFNRFRDKLKEAIESCFEIKDRHYLSQRLSEVFRNKNILQENQVNIELKHTISRKLPKSTVFISHANADKIFARKLISELSKDDSIDFWIDEKEILVGADIQKTITKSLQKTDYLLLIISNSSAKSDWVNFEVSQFMSIANGENIIPIKIAKTCEFPEPVNNLLNRLRYLDFTDNTRWHNNINELKQALKNNR